MDMRTVIFSYIISAAICAIVMASLWRRNRQRSPELAFWLADFVMQFAGLLLIVLRGTLPNFFSMVVSNTLIIGGTLLLFIGLERYTRKISSQWHNYIYLALFVSAQMYFVYVQPDIQARNINISLGLLVMCAQCAWLLLRRVDSAMRSDTREAGVAFGVFSLVSLIRILIDLALPPQSDFFKSGLYDTLIILTYQMLYVSLTFTLLLMVSRRLLMALESDMAEKNLAEEALRVSEEKFSIAFYTSPYAVTITRAEDGKFIDVNDAFTAITGITREEALADSSLGLNLWVNEDDRRNVVASLRAGQAVTGKEFLFRRKDGGIVTGLFSAHMVEINYAHYILSSINDITERKQAETALLEKEVQYHNLADSGLALIWTAGTDKLCNYFNQPWLKFTGRTMQQEMGNGWAKGVHPDDFDRCLQTYVTAFDKREAFDMEYRLRHVSGEYRWLQDLGTPNYNSSGEFVGYIGHCFDITERKLAEEKIRELNATLEQRVEERTRELRDAQDQLVRHEKLSLLGQMAGSVGHELRNPLAAISNAIYFLKMVQPDAPDKVKEYLNLIERNIHISDKIIGDLLDFTRIKSAKREPVSVPQLIQQTLERFPAPENVQVTLDLSVDLPKVYVDPQYLIQVFSNLVLNACQAMADGGKLVISSCIQNEMICIAVKDGGMGISAENMKKLFEPLFTTKPKGIGLGLAVSQKLIEANGGRIEVESEVGVGSTFTVWLPVEK